MDLKRLLLAQNLVVDSHLDILVPDPAGIAAPLVEGKAIEAVLSDVGQALVDVNGNHLFPVFNIFPPRRWPTKDKIIAAVVIRVGGAQALPDVIHGIHGDNRARVHLSDFGQNLLQPFPRLLVFPDQLVRLDRWSKAVGAILFGNLRPLDDDRVELPYQLGAAMVSGVGVRLIPFISLAHVKVGVHGIGHQNDAEARLFQCLKIEDESVIAERPRFAGVRVEHDVYAQHHRVDASLSQYFGVGQIAARFVNARCPGTPVE